jgi:3-hydroxyacyl-[acyl-carrier-protein] dehydratase
MSKPLLDFEEVRSLLKQRFPMLMVDSVVALEPGKSIRATKNVTGSELHFLGQWVNRPSG